MILFTIKQYLTIYLFIRSCNATNEENSFSFLQIIFSEVYQTHKRIPTNNQWAQWPIEYSNVNLMFVPTHNTGLLYMPLKTQGLCVSVRRKTCSRSSSSKYNSDIICRNYPTTVGLGTRKLQIQIRRKNNTVCGGL